MKQTTLAFALLLLPLFGRPGIAAAAPGVRVKDVTRIKGSESYTLVGYGVVVGLAGSGDSDEQLTQGTLANVLQNFNVVVDEENLKANNAAAVMVTATVRRAANRGDMLAVTVSSVGDATSLTGGELLLTPLLGTDGEPWAIAQGAVTTGAYAFGGGGEGGETASKNHPTTGVVSKGAKLLKDVNIGLQGADALTLCLHQPDFTSAVNMAEAINGKYFGSALAVDPATVRVRLPGDIRAENRIAEFIRDIEQVTFSPDRSARVVFSERTGTIVIGSEVRISSAAISHGSITINIKNTQQVSQPPPFARRGDTVETTDQTTDVVEGDGDIKLLPDTTTVGDLVRVLNQLGVKPRDTMAIFHALRQAGALHAVIESM